MHIVLIKNEKKMGHSQKHIWDWTYTNTIFGGYFIKNLSLHSWYNPKLGLFIVLNLSFFNFLTSAIGQNI